MVQRYLTVEQTAEYTGIQTKTLYNWTPEERARLGGTKIGRIVRFDKEVLDQYLKEQREKMLP